MKASVPTIGLIGYGKAKDPKWFSLPRAYVEAIRRSGGRPVIIPPGEPDVGSYIDVIDGFVLAGGGDIESHYFNQENHPKNSDIDPERDATELEMTRALIEQRTPTLAICRGIQILNVALGGELIQHL
jgi:putative glutamine amidotransferase